MKGNQQQTDPENRHSHKPGQQDSRNQQTGLRNDDIRENPDRAESGASAGEGGLGEQTEKEGGLGREKLQPPVE